MSGYAVLTMMSRTNTAKETKMSKTHNGCPTTKRTWPININGAFAGSVTTLTTSFGDRFLALDRDGRRLSERPTQTFEEAKWLVTQTAERLSH